MPADTPLHKAAHQGDLAQCKNIIDAGEIDVNAPGASDRRPLHRAAGGNHIEIATFLLEKGAGIDQTDKSGRTALHWAAISGHKAMSELLIEKGANIMAATNSKMTALHGASESGRAELVKYFLSVAGDKLEELCNMKDAEDKTAFDVAMAGNHKQVAKTLKEGGDPNAASASCLIQ